jgi:hypothetical protein
MAIPATMMPPTMTPEAKRQLSATIRGLRERLLTDLHAATDSAYRLAVRAQDAGLSEAARARRTRLEAWMDEQVRAQSTGSGASGKGAAAKRPARLREDFRLDAEKQAAYTLLNRLVILRLMEASGLRSPAVVTGGWSSRGYADFRLLAPALARRTPGADDETEGFAFLLRLVFEDLATDLPGLYGAAGVAELVPVPASTLRHVIEALDEPELASCWTDDMTLGWVYQYWNDPEREKLDAKLAAGGKVEPHEIASKTQMFTERYMVDWLLQNSLGPMWLAMCNRHGWTPACEADGTLAALEARRVAWRAKREAGPDAGGVALSELMPLETDMERRWAYYVPQPIPADAVEHAPESVRALKILDPAVGSGHFLVVAFDLLVALYREEAQHRGEAGEARWTDRAIVEHILEHNLHGIDLDPRAVQIAAAALWLKAKQTCATAEPQRLNLVASNLRLASLPENDEALVELRREVERETGMPAKLTDRVVEALRGADHLGSLLKVDAAVDEAIDAHEAELGRVRPEQGNLFSEFGAKKRDSVAPAAAKAGIVERLERFLDAHGSQDDLGLRLRGEQLAGGIRFLRLVQEGQYDLVVGNPPYQGTSKMTDAVYVQKHYPRGKADLYAAFLERGLQLARDGGVSALLTMRNWMFISQYSDLRRSLLEKSDLRSLGDFAIGAFDSVPNDVLSVVVSVFRRAFPQFDQSAAQQPTPPNDHSYDRERTQRKRAATLCHVGRHVFDPAALKIVPQWPLIYWWSKARQDDYRTHGLLGDYADVVQGLGTRAVARFERLHWEVPRSKLHVSRYPATTAPKHKWVPYVKGAAGRAWFEPLSNVVNWVHSGLELFVWLVVYGGTVSKYARNPSYYFRQGVAFTPIGDIFLARIHRFHGILSDAGSSVFSDDNDNALCLMNTTLAREILSALNPSVNFVISDVQRLPNRTISLSSSIVRGLESAFSQDEAHREPSIEARGPGPSPWRHAQRWAQVAVDRPDGAPLPEYTEELDPEPPTDHVSFALGVALGRFGANGAGILDNSTLASASALPAGILFLDGSLEPTDSRDSLSEVSAKQLLDAWTAHGAAIDERSDLRTYLRLRFFADVHRQMYENRPIHWPLSSEKKTFVAWINIHRWDAHTLRALLAEHLHTAQLRLDGELTDLRAARDGADKRAARAAEKRLDKVLKWRDELADFVANVTQCAEKGAAPTDPKCPHREVDGRYDPDVDDGVMINSAALWPLLEPQWKEPKKWWKELSTSKGKKDYDWSHLAMRYWPKRVDDKCRKDPSLGVAHGCFWRYHPERAWAWELRLQDEIGPEFRIEERPYDPPGLPSGPTGDRGDAPHRAAYLRDHGSAALDAIEKEAVRRLRAAKKAGADPAKLTSELRILEPGLWSSMPGACWALELRLAEKSGADFHLRAPEEPAGRAAFQAAHPERVVEREKLVRGLAATQLALLGDEDDGEESVDPEDDDERDGADGEDDDS